MRPHITWYKSQDIRSRDNKSQDTRSPECPRSMTRNIAPLLEGTFHRPSIPVLMRVAGLPDQGRVLGRHKLLPVHSVFILGFLRGLRFELPFCTSNPVSVFELTSNEHASHLTRS